MKKRIMLILALGLSFAPPAFAASPDASTGEMKVSKHKGQSIRCALLDQKPFEKAGADAGSTVRTVRVNAGAIR